MLTVLKRHHKFKEWKRAMTTLCFKKGSIGRGVQYKREKKDPRHSYFYAEVQQVTLNYFIGRQVEGIVDSYVSVQSI